MPLNFEEQNMKKILRHIRTPFALVLLLLAVSCESVLFIELEEGEKLIVVNGMLASDSTAAVQVSRTRHILDNKAVAPLKDATVKLLEEEREVGVMNYTENGWFVLEGFLPSAGKSYSLQVEHEAYPNVSAFTEIPAVVGIGGLDTLTVTIDYDDGYGWIWSESMFQFDLQVEDPAGEDNYYLLSTQLDRSWTEFRDITVEVRDSLWHNDAWHFFMKDSTFTFEEIHYVTEYPGITSEDIVVESSTSHGVLFSDRLFDGKSYSFRGEIREDYLRSAEPAHLSFFLKSISESYYKYLKSRQKHYETKEDYLSVPVIVYSNVEEGTGFLGGYSVETLTIITFVPEFGENEYYY